MKVINLDERRKSRGKPALLVNHATGKVTSSEPQPEFENRLQRIRASLEKINRLMADLKKMNGPLSQDCGDRDSN